MKKKKYTLQAKMKKTYLLFFSVILILASVAIYLITSRIYWEKTGKLCEQMVDMNLELLNTEVAELQNRHEMIAKNADVKEAVSYFQNEEATDYPKEIQIQRKLTDIFYLYAQSDKVVSAYIIDKKGECRYFYKESPKVGYNMMNQEWYRNLTDDIVMDTCYVSEIHDKSYLVNHQKDLCLSIVRPIQVKTRYRFEADAYLVCDISLDAVFKKNRADESMQFAMLDKNGTFYAPDTFTFTEEESDKIIQLAKENDVYVSVESQRLIPNHMVLSKKSNLFGWKIIGVKNLDELNDMTAMFLIVLAGTIVITIFLMAILSRKVAKTLLSPMNTLIEECNRVSKGESNVQFQDKPSREVAFLSQTIESMVTNIVELSNQVIEEERELSEEKLRLLQHQINPHFLNNVLQTIKALAVAGETEKVSRITTLLGHILAYSVYEPYENVEFGMELEYLKYYIELQNIRYNNRIICSIDCEEIAEHLQIPKLTLQPLVENSINHGLREKGTLVISVSTDIEKDSICVIISDNGKGIEEKELKELREHLKNGESFESKSSIGILNVNERLKRIFGERCEIQIHSRYEAGTTVVIVIPREEE